MTGKHTPNISLIDDRKPGQRLRGYIAALTILAACLLPAGVSGRECIDCHKDRALTGKNWEGKEVPIHVDPAAWRLSAHAGIGCESCHPQAGDKDRPTRRPVRCVSCHEAEGKELAASIHGPYFEPVPDGPSPCLKCHDNHYERPSNDPESRLARPQNVRICLGCHSDESRLPAERRETAGTIRAYSGSVHGRVLLSGERRDAPGCVECHGAHEVRPADAPASPVHKPNLPQLCGGCHKDEAAAYGEGIHGRALAEGVMESPSCADCHGEHAISPPTDPASTVSPGNVSATCAHCHAAESIVDRFGLSRAVVRTYQGSFHGITNRYGRAEAANCSSCHGYHDIRPPSDPESRVNPANLPETCGQCHPNAGVNFARGRVHVEASPESSIGIYIVRKFYTWLIVVLGAGFLIHMGLQIWSARRRRGNEGG